MTQPSVPRRHLLPAVLLAAAPGGLVLLLLTAGGWLGLGAALLALAGLLLLAWALVRAQLAPVLTVALHVRDVAHGVESPTPDVSSSGLAEELMGAVGLLRKSCRQIQAELQAQLGSAEMTLDSLPDPLFLLDGQRRIVRTNQAARKLFGRDIDGRDLAAVLRDPGVLEAAERAADGRGGASLEFVLPGPVERTFGTTVEPLPTRSADGTVTMLALHDLTALKRIEQMRADFVANASHELRTPLSALLGFIETLRGPAKDDPEAHDRFLAIMSEQASRMSRLVNDLLSLSRIELNEHTQPSGRVDLAKVLRQITEGLTLHAESRHVALDLTLPEGLAAVMGQEDELIQVFQNLVDNAIKYGRDGAPVEIAVALVDRVPTAMGQQHDAGAVRVTVRDHGEGIAKEHLPRLTERFYRVDTARSRKLGGTGLGLAIVKHIINRHRGALTIDSALGKGSTFTVYLPAAE